MSSLRDWQLTPSHPLSLQIAADARLSSTDYFDDQIWEIVLGAVDLPALAAQTRLGGRVGLFSLVPMWWIANRPIYQYQAYTSPPVVNSFAPGYIEVLARITPRLALRAEYWAAESHGFGGRYTLKNSQSSPIDVGLDLVLFAAAAGHELQTKIAPRLNGSGLSGLKVEGLGRTTSLIVLEGGTATLENSSHKLSARLTIKGGGTVSIRWVHTGEANLTDCFERADALLAAHWTSAFRKIASHADPIPRIETGDTDTDAAIAFAYQSLMQSFISPTTTMPHESFVGTRQPEQGYSRQGNGTDYPRAWSGQSPILAYLTALAVAPIDGGLAEGIVRNYLAFQQPDGWIDWKPGAAGQRANLMCLPILARLTWEIYSITGNKDFLSEVFPGIARFVNHWLRPDFDQDRDGLPEWASEQQTGFPYMPTFATGLVYGQNADIRTVEASDLAAYLRSEIGSLLRIAQILGDTSLNDTLSAAARQLSSMMEQLWNGEHYAYRDRDSHQSQTKQILLQAGRADEEHLLAEQFKTPQRLIVRIIGGLDRVVRLTVTIDGRGANGEAVHEKLENNAFTWANGRGVCTTTALYSQVDRIRAEGISRVYKINVDTVDHQRRDVSSLIPIWSGAVSDARAAALVQQITDPAHFWLPNGVTMVSARDSQFPSIKTGEGGGIWTYWVTLIGEGLLNYGYPQQAAELLRRVLRVQIAVLKANKAFSEFYHTSESTGLGERGHIAGLVPLHLLSRVLGVQIVSKTRVRAGGVFAWGSDVTVTAYGVTVKRGTTGTLITFPSGHTVTLDANAPFQTINDPNAPVDLHRASTSPHKES